MKRIEAIIREENLEPVKTALEAIGMMDMLVFNCRWHGAQGGVNLAWRAGTYRVDFLHRLMLSLVVQDDRVQAVTDNIIRVCREDEAGCDGSILISPLEERIEICPEKKD